MRRAETVCNNFNSNVSILLYVASWTSKNRWMDLYSCFVKKTNLVLIFVTSMVVQGLAKCANICEFTDQGGEESRKWWCQGSDMCCGEKTSSGYVGHWKPWLWVPQEVCISTISVILICVLILIIGFILIRVILIHSGLFLEVWVTIVRRMSSVQRLLWSSQRMRKILITRVKASVLARFLLKTVRHPLKSSS